MRDGLRSGGNAVLALTAALVWGVIGGMPGPAQAAKPAPRFAVRYLCFTATSKPGRDIPPARRLHEAQSRLRLREVLTTPLTADPKVYLNRLSQAAPEYDFSVSLSGLAEQKSGEFVVADGSKPADPFALKLEDRFRLIPDPDLPTQVRVSRTGKLEWKGSLAEQLEPTPDGRAIAGNKSWSGFTTWFLGRSEVDLVTWLDYAKNDQPTQLVYCLHGACVEALPPR
jgi:hypothetical protein